MTTQERQALEEKAAALEDFLEHPENWARLQTDSGEIEYKYLGPPQDFTHNKN